MTTSTSLSHLENEPRVTVLMPVFNAEQFLREAVDSILQQSFRNFVLFAIDDGSTDSSVAILRSYADTRIKIIQRKENGGVVAALNSGLDEVRTQYIARMDADDVSMPDRLQRLVTFMDANGHVGVCSSALQLFGDDDAIWRLPITDEEIKAKLLFQSALAHPTCIIRTSVLLQGKIRYRSEHPHLEDHDLWFRLKNKTTFAALPDVIYKYRVLQHNVTVQNKDTSIERRKNISQMILAELDITPTEAELNYHVGELPVAGANAANWLEGYLAWHEKLRRQNGKLNYYNVKCLEQELENRWVQLFYKLTEIGNEFVAAYFKASDSVPRKLKLYYLKYRTNKLLGRNG